MLTAKKRGNMSGHAEGKVGRCKGGVMAMGKKSRLKHKISFSLKIPSRERRNAVETAGGAQRKKTLSGKSQKRTRNASVQKGNGEQKRKGKAFKGSGEREERVTEGTRALGPKKKRPSIAGKKHSGKKKNNRQLPLEPPLEARKAAKAGPRE